MVFNPPTAVNYSNADLYAYERQKIQQYNYHLRYRPEIMSHVYIEISYNTQLTDNTEIPWYRKIRFTVRSRKKFCSQTSCQLHYPRGNTCRPKDLPRLFKTGDHDVESCQFGCYNLYEMSTMPQEQETTATETSAAAKTTATTAENKSEKKITIKDEEYVRAPFLIYSYGQCACTIHNNSLFALGIDDYMRTDNHPTPRIDTIGTGFHYVDSGNFFERENFDPQSNKPYTDIEGNESFRFNINRYYCDDFRLKFDGRKCYESVGEKIFGFLVSSTLYKACQYGVRFAATGVTNTDVQKLSLPPVNYRVHHDTFDSWKNDVDPTAFFIDPNVSLLDLGFTEDTKHCIFTTQYQYPGELIVPLASPYQQKTDQQQRQRREQLRQIDYAQLNKGRLYQFQYDVMTGQRLIDEYEVYGIYKYIRQNPTKSNFNQDDYMTPPTKLSAFIQGLINNLGETSLMLTLGYLSDKGLQYSQKLLTLATEYLEGQITPTLLHIVEREMLTQTLKPVVQVFSNTIASMARISTNLLKTTDVFTTIVGVLDLFDLAIDFFNMNNIMDSGTIQQYSQLDIDVLKRAYGFGTVEYSPVTFMLMCEKLKLYKNWKVTPTATKKLYCNTDYKKYKYMIPVTAVINYQETNNSNTYEWISEYIFSLRINSNGLNINWEDENKLSSDIIDQYTKIDESVYVHGMDAYSTYTENFRERVTYAKYGLVIALILLLVIIVVYVKVVVPFIFVVALVAFYITFSYVNK